MTDLTRALINHPAIQPLKQRASSLRGRLVVLAGIIVVALNARIMVATVSPIISLIVADIPLTSTDQAIIGLTAPLCFAVFGFLAPTLGRRLGLEATMIAAIAVSLIGEIGRSTAVSPIEFIIWTVPTLAGAGVSNVITPPLIKKYFPDRVGMVTAIYTAFATISTGLPPLFILQIAHATGWRFSAGVWAGVGVIGLLPWIAVVFSRKRSGARLAAIKRRLNPRTSVERPPALAKPLWRRPLAWALMITFSVNSIIGYTMFAWLPPMLRSAGYSEPAAAAHLAVFALGSLPGALLVPMLVARLRRVWILPPIFFIGYVIGFVGLALAPQYALAWMIISRVGDAFFPYSLTMINLRTSSTRGSIAMSGFVQAVGYTIAVIGPLGFGLLHDLTAGWQAPMIALIAVLPLQLIGGLVVAKARPLPA
ncbi:MAG: MFS transporter [Propionibacteriaceae bacterium]|jgi:CP family cyanate transporter-like MFS transporter|nr:MFS transporter [Propionibacteriaceae bacterium]